MTTETKFTPGPWSREDATVYTSAKDGGNRFGAWFTRGFDDNGRRIENSEVVANATLAQAAPDMYAALNPFAQKQFHEVLAGNTQGDDSILWERNGARLTIGDFRRAADALAKAQGKP